MVKKYLNKTKQNKTPHTHTHIITTKAGNRLVHSNDYLWLLTQPLI